MSKLSRTVLKEIVKECIVEIFAESFFSDDSSVISEVKSKKHTSQRIKRPVTRQTSRQSHLDNINYNQSQKPAFDSQVNHIAKNLTNDPVMESIFKDTAFTTLQNQKSNRMPISTSGDNAAIIVDQSDPTELFAESANKWATLAFSEKIIK